MFVLNDLLFLRYHEPFNRNHAIFWKEGAMFVRELPEYYDEPILFLITSHVAVFRKLSSICDTILLNLLNGMAKDKRSGFIHLRAEGSNDPNTARLVPSSCSRYG